MTREEIISAWEFVEDGLPFDAIESKDNRVDMHELIYYTIEALSAIEDIKAEIEAKAKEREFYLDAGHPYNGLYEALKIIDKHISGKESE